MSVTEPSPRIGNRNAFQRSRQLVAILTLALLSIATCDDLRTFDICNSGTGCAKDLPCVVQDMRHDDMITFCLLIPKQHRKGDCLCFPQDLLQCESSADCPAAEYCAVNSKTNNVFCVGCLTIQDADRGFTAVDDEADSCIPPDIVSTPSGIQSMGDFCSPVKPCRPSMTCLKAGAVYEECSANDIICTCFRPDAFCETPSDCPDGESCFKSTYNGFKQCASCNALYNDVTLKEEKDDSKCNGVAPRPFPVYPSSPNGLSGDPCSSDLTCADPYRCRIANDNFRTSTMNKSGQYCQMDDPQPCKASGPCPIGEVCISRTGKNATSPQCYSKAVVDRLEEGEFKLISKGLEALELPDGNGYTRDECKFDWNCVPSRRCTHIEENFGGCAGRRACQCIPLAPQVCNTDKDCETGEQCASPRGAVSKPRCISSIVLAKDTTFRFQSENKGDQPPLPKSDGLTGDSCVSNEDCQSPEDVKRKCEHVADETGDCSSGLSCFCNRSKAPVCSSSDDCVKGEMCVSVKDSLKPQPMCRSFQAVSDDVHQVYEVYKEEATLWPSEEADVDPSPAPVTVPSPTTVAVPSPTPVAVPSGQSEELEEEEMETGTVGENESDSPEGAEETEVCIDARALAKFGHGDLVYATARRARTLCDRHGNCATPGHMVVWQERAMMMKKYCEWQGDCVERRMLVNSPRISRALRIPSRTSGLQFTALAARFESRVEEAMLAAIVHAGF